ncbi:lamin tail domain-containing protein [Streptomyces sp. 21So2-11]|uniref:lamin tail domain-containing protein n=1 Tax=Streptomyces sp. 21So2-11 TaxID=3144408 RepID=UPI00321A4DAE
MSASRNARRIAAAVLAAGAVIGAAALPASADHRDRDWDRDRSAVVIGDVQYDSPGHDDQSNRSLNNEWIEVKNKGRHTVNLRNFTLTNRDGQRYRFTNVRLHGRSAIKVHTGFGRDSRHDVFQDRRDYVWDNRSDKAILRNDRGRVIDTESWGRGHHR